MGEIVGRFTCPVCGEPLQDVKSTKTINYIVFAIMAAKRSWGRKTASRL